MSSLDATTPRSRSIRPAEVVGIGALALLFVAGLTWAKWVPYAEKIDVLADTGAWDGSPIFITAGSPGSAPSLSGAWDFTAAYFEAVWKAVVVALLVAAAIDALIPRDRLTALLNRRTYAGQSALGGLCSLPSLMCTCCTAPVAVGLRQRGTALAAGLAYWLGNPVLNPAVLAFLFLVAPWELAAVRILVGAILVFGATALVARLFGSRVDSPQAATGPTPTQAADSEPQRIRDLPGRYLRCLFRFTVILVPEYLAVIFAVGLVSGWLSDFAGLEARLGVLAVVACALIGTLLVIPTGGEIPVVLGLAAAGVGAGPVGALLVTLPALSLPSMVMVGRAFTWRVTFAMAGAVALAGLLTAILLAAVW